MLTFCGHDSSSLFCPCPSLSHLKMLVQTYFYSILKAYYMFTIFHNESTTFLTSLTSPSCPFTSYHLLSLFSCPSHAEFLWVYLPLSFFQCTLYNLWPQNQTLAFSVCQGAAPLDLCFYTIHLNNIISLFPSAFQQPLQCSKRCFTEEWRLPTVQAHSFIQTCVCVCIGWLEWGLTKCLSARCLVLLNIWTAAELFFNAVFWGHFKLWLFFPSL